MPLCIVAAAVLSMGSKTVSAPPAQKSKSEPINLAVTGQSNYFEWPDEKRPGKFVAKLWARSFQLKSPQQTIYYSFNGIHGILFQQGEPSAIITAPHADGDSVREVIHATGRVTLTSYKNRKTWIKADRVDWNAKNHQGYATGNVIMHYQTGMEMHTPRLKFDTALRTVESASGYGTLP